MTQALCPVCAVSYEEVRGDRRGAPVQARGGGAGPEDAGRDPRRRAYARAGDGPRAGGGGAARRRPPSGSTRSATRGAGSARPRVLAVEWLDPVFVAGHWTPQLIELAGGEDVMGFAGEPSPGARLGGPEGGARREVVVVMPCGYDAPRAQRGGGSAHAPAARRAGGRAGDRGGRRGLLLPAGTAADRRAGAAGPHPAPRARALAAAGRAGARGRAHGSGLSCDQRPARATVSRPCSTGPWRSSPRTPPRRSPRTPRAQHPVAADVAEAQDGGRERTPDQAADVPSPRDPGDREADDQVEHDQRPRPHSGRSGSGGRASRPRRRPSARRSRPEAPTVRTWGETSRAPNEPHSSETP